MRRLLRGATVGSRGGRYALLLALTGLIGGPGAAHGQSLAQRAQVRDGKVRLSFPARPDVCGSGNNISVGRGSDDWVGDCSHGPVRLVLTWRAGRLVDVDTYVGGRWRDPSPGTVDLGDVPAADAVSLLLELARRQDGSGKNLVFPATLADGPEPWPMLIALARDAGVPQGTRRQAVFWLGQAAGERVADQLKGLVTSSSGDEAVQESAVFALSQMRNGAGVDALVDIAKSHPNPDIRKKAMFWLAQSNDPRALQIFEDVLRAR